MYYYRNLVKKKEHKNTIITSNNRFQIYIYIYININLLRFMNIVELNYFGIISENFYLFIIDKKVHKIKMCNI